MVKKSNKKKKVSKFIYWTPRILSILFLLFLAMFSLDIFGNNYTFWQTVLGLLIHNIPTFVLAIILIVSWKHEIVGGIAFILAGLFYILMSLIILVRDSNQEWYTIFWSLTLSGPAFLIGILFLINWFRKKH